MLNFATVAICAFDANRERQKKKRACCWRAPRNPVHAVVCVMQMQFKCNNKLFDLGHVVEMVSDFFFVLCFVNAATPICEYTNLKHKTTLLLLMA